MSEKKLQDYIPYYIGCRCLNTWFPEGHNQYDNNWILMGFHLGYPKPYCLENDEDTTWTDSIKPILRRLESITVEEFVEAVRISDKDAPEEEIRKHHPDFAKNGMNQMSVEVGKFHVVPEIVRFFTLKGFDIFRLIEYGLAIDSATLPKIN